MMKRLLTSLLLVMAFTATVAQDDVDTRIAVNDETDANTFVVIIANENYKYEHPVAFALNDGETFRLYCEKTLGIPAKNIRYAADATLNDMRMQLQWLEGVMGAYEGEARAIVYYSGHGMPSEDGGHAHLLPVDGNSRMAISGMSIAELFKQLGKMPSKGTIVLLDACFSGARRDGKMLASSRGVAIKAKDEPVTGNMVVLSAAQGDETAYSYQEKQHGLFTYFILSTLQEKGGCVSLGELSDNVVKMVKRTSFVENDKSQTPTVWASAASANWRGWMMAKKVATHYKSVASNENTDNPTNQETKVLTESVAPTPPAPSSPPAQPFTTYTVNGVSFVMVCVEGGTFHMGSYEKDDEKPIHQVQLSTFHIGQTEVTQELWEAVMGSNPSKYEGRKRPVEGVSWDDCQVFIAKLNALTGKSFHLPTEAEWEFAALGGNKSQGYKFSGSNNIKDVAWQNCLKTHDVATKHPNELMLYDMTGNVLEWCQDWYDNYSTFATTNPTGPKSGTHRVMRGGSCPLKSSFCRIACRFSHKPSTSGRSMLPNFFFGLRLAL